MIQLDDTFCKPWMQTDSLLRLQRQLRSAFLDLWDERIDGEFKGWMHYPERDHSRLIEQIESIAERFRAASNVTVVVGIGGSYLGAKAALSVCRPIFFADAPERVLFAGHHLSPTYHGELLRYLERQEVTLVVVSKSGGTMEPSAAFHVLRAYMEERYGASAKDRICAITDPDRGALRTFAIDHGYERLPIPADIGGRFSGLTAVGLFPMALCGISLRDVLAGAQAGLDAARTADFESNASVRYALLRHMLYLRGFSIEALVTYRPEVASFTAWWQQLFGESQGKDGVGLYPTTLHYTSDLHSMGQYVQDARRLLFETVLDWKCVDAFKHTAQTTVQVPENVDEANQLLAGRTFANLEDIAVTSVATAHALAGVPNLIIQPTGTPEFVFGELVYFFEHACALGGYLLGIHPFNQPGVEAYKQQMTQRLV